MWKHGLRVQTSPTEFVGQTETLNSTCFYKGFGFFVFTEITLKITHSCLLPARSIPPLTASPPPRYTQDVPALRQDSPCHHARVKTFQLQNARYKGRLQQRTHLIRSAEALCQTVEPIRSFPSQNTTLLRPIGTRAKMTSTGVLSPTLQVCWGWALKQSKAHANFIILLRGLDCREESRAQRCTHTGHLLFDPTLSVHCQVKGWTSCLKINNNKKNTCECNVH